MISTNEEWLRALRAEGDERDAALAELRTALLRGLRGAMAGRGVDSGVIEDAVQDALLRILDRLDTFRGESRFTTWALTIAVRGVWTELRRRRWKDVSLEALVDDRERPLPATLSDDPDVTARLDQGSLIAQVHEAIANDLTPKQRTALLAELAGMPQAEIARRMGSNRNALYKLVHDARKRLKRALEAAGYGADDVAAAFDRTETV